MGTAIREMRYCSLVLRKIPCYSLFMKHIGISLRFHDSYDKAVAKGIIRYAKGRSDWTLHGSGSALRPLQFSGKDRVDALIARIDSDEEADRLATLRIPIVDIAGAHVRSVFHRVQNDDFLTGRRAGEYLRRLGAKNFAFCGVERVFWSRQRLIGFAEAVGVSPERLRIFDRSLHWWSEQDDSHALTDWLRALPRSIALFCCNDIAGVKVATHCRIASLQIPRDVTLLGVDDEDLLCELSTPSLSSVRLDCDLIGFRSAELIESILTGEGSGAASGAASGTAIRIAPRDIVERESTTMVMESDPVVAQAVRFIRQNAVRGIAVEDVVAACDVSRRTLEIRFKAARNRTLHQEILQERMDRVRYLLKETDLTIETIANECGFSNAQRLYVFFSQQEGMTPGQWRSR
jgi:LacI family transcriptional regulator